MAGLQSLFRGGGAGFAITQGQEANQTLPPSGYRSTSNQQQGKWIRTNRTQPTELFFILMCCTEKKTGGKKQLRLYELFTNEGKRKPGTVFDLTSKCSYLLLYIASIHSFKGFPNLFNSGMGWSEKEKNKMVKKKTSRKKTRSKSAWSAPQAPDNRRKNRRERSVGKEKQTQPSHRCP